MAIQKKIELDTGIILDEAYIRITEGMLSLDKGTAFIIVETYADVEARNAKKVPVFRKEHKCDMTGGQPLVNAEYLLHLNEVPVKSALKLTVDVNGDGTKDIELTEGINLTTDGTHATLTKAVVDKLNADVLFNESFIAEYLGERYIKITPVTALSGSKGNSLKITGTMVGFLNLEKVGQDKKLSEFETYFGLEAMNKEGSNVILQGYEFIKNLPDYQGGIDVI